MRKNKWANHAQQPCFSKSSPDDFVIFKITNSSALVGWIPMALCKSLNFKPSFMATAKPSIYLIFIYPAWLHLHSAPSNVNQEPSYHSSYHKQPCNKLFYFRPGNLDLFFLISPPLREHIENDKLRSLPIFT